jgi:hypothetical protein
LVIDASKTSDDTQFFFNLDYNSGRHLGVGELQYIPAYQSNRFTGYTQSTIKDGQRSSSATSYLAPQFSERKNLHVLLRAQVARVLSSANQNKSQPSFDTVEFTDGVGGQIIQFSRNLY